MSFLSSNLLPDIAFCGIDTIHRFPCDVWLRVLHKVEKSQHEFLKNHIERVKAMAGTQMVLLCFVLMASWINRTLMSPVAEQHTAAFDEIARVNEQYGKTFLLSSSLDKCPFPFVLAFLKERGRFCITRHPSSVLEGSALRITSVCAGVCASCVWFSHYIWEPSEFHLLPLAPYVTFKLVLKLFHPSKMN